MDQELKRKQSFLLRLPISVRQQATEIAREEGTSLNHFISLAVAEKISRMGSNQQSKSISSGIDEHRSHTPDFRSLRFPRLA
jgi:hypothetical protein